jgi:hypothetical protein
MLAVALPLNLLVYLVVSSVLVAFEKSDRYVEAAAVTVVALAMFLYVLRLLDFGSIRLIERWAAGQQVDRESALGATYTWVRRVTARWMVVSTVWAALLSVVVGAVAGATGSRLVQYGILGAAVGTGAALTGGRTILEAAMRPPRLALAGDTGIGDALPRSRPTFAGWSSLCMLGTAFAFAVSGAMLAAVLNQASENPVLCAVIGAGLTIFIAVPITVGSLFSPSLLPIRDLAQATERVAAGNYGQRVCRWFKATISAQWRDRSTACRRDWLSGNDFRRRSALTSTRLWRHGCLSRVTTCSPVSTAR